MTYTRCPKCGHAPLPENQAVPAACPGCGIILAKLGTARPARRASVIPPVGEDLSHHPALATLLHGPQAVDKTLWLGRAGLLIAFCSWTLWIFAAVDVPAGEAGSFILWAVLTPFHEAGHTLVFRWFGEFIMILGGTLGQHLMPLVLAGALLTRRRDPFGAALFMWLFGFSLIMMAVYMYDAFDPRLMLLDGRTEVDSDGHDWQNLFGDLGLLKRSRGIGLFFGWIGRAVMIASLCWAGLVVWLQRARLTDSPFAECEPDA